MVKPIIITSLKIKKPGQVKSLRDLCKYLQFRDGSVRREAFLGKENSGISIVQNSQGNWGGRKYRLSSYLIRCSCADKLLQRLNIRPCPGDVLGEGNRVDRHHQPEMLGGRIRVAPTRRSMST